jgi:hypothetical protein
VYVLARVDRRWLALEVMAGVDKRWLAVVILAGVDGWSAVEVLAGFTRIFPAPVNFSHNSTVDHLLSPSARTSTEDQLPSTAALVGPGHLRTSRLELTEGGWLCMSLLN